MRTVSSPSQTEIVKPITQPGYFVELQFGGGTVRLCSFGTTTWNSLTWTGESFEMTGPDADGLTAGIVLWDMDAGFRTLATTSGGIRNKIVKIWEAQLPALGVGDPNMIFYGIGDEVHIAQGKTTISCVRTNALYLLAPRERISAETGFNFLAAPGRKIYWGNTVITLSAPAGGG
jgi:hypothetical protein